ncbi:hypothetical protein SK128_004600 [Halocaridina rubra]|uniref:Uncharacterized protein n=1 Tax=Halocaridina rubra TaxID=373956 RepID=A0AAN8XCJ7_HALRR
MLQQCFIIEKKTRKNGGTGPQVELQHNSHIYYKNIIKHMPRLPLDVSCPIMDEVYAPSRLDDISVVCEKCGTPWLAGHFKSRLQRRPKKDTLVRSLIKKDRRRRGKIKNSEKLQLVAYKKNLNTLEVTCLICNHKRESYCKGSKSIKQIKTNSSVASGKDDLTLIASQALKKISKKKKKEFNSGLIISRESQQLIDKANNPEETLEKTKKREKSKKKENEKNAAAPSATLKSGETSVDDENDCESISRRLADSILAGSNANYRKHLKTVGPIKKSKKQQDRFNKRLKTKICSEEVAKTKKSCALESFLSSLF